MRMRNVMKTAGIAFALWMGYAAWHDFSSPQNNPTAAYSDVAKAAEEGRVASALFVSNPGGRDWVEAVDSKGERLRAVLPGGSNDLAAQLLAKKASVSFSKAEGSLLAATGTGILAILPLALLGALLWAMSGAAKRIGQQIGGDGKKSVLAERPKTRLADVAGVEEAKRDVSEVVDFLRAPDRFAHLGAKIPKGVLLVGPPGTGKTLLAKAVAGEADVPFLAASGSGFVEMFVGMGAKRVRELFDEARKAAPCIVFIDEIDAVGQKRGGPSSHQEREQTLNEMLVQMDGMDGRSGVIVLAATNRVDTLDPALIRPGRFDRQVHVDVPDLSGREAILKVHSNGKPLSPEVDLNRVARATPGFSGADLGNLVNEAALLAGRRGGLSIGPQDFENARDRILMGPERPSLSMTEQEKRLTAYHEAGHALIAVVKPDSDRIHKATIAPRGGALGMVLRLPEGDRVSLSMARILADMAVAMGGKAAEELIFGKDRVTTGASQDLRMASSLARRMVTEWGMSEVVGPISYAEGAGGTAYSDLGGRPMASPATAEKIDAEVRRILEEAYADAKAVLIERRTALEAIAGALIDKETLDGAEIEALVAANP